MEIAAIYNINDKELAIMAQIIFNGRKLGVTGIAHLHKVLLSNDKRLKNSYGIGKEEIIKKDERG